MCGRLVSGSDDKTWREWVEILRPNVEAPPPPERPAQPGADLAAFVSNRDAATGVSIADAIWGLRLVGPDRRLYFNSRLESVAQRFKDELAAQRALIPATRFEVAEGEAGEKNRRRHQVAAAAPLLLAGIWARDEEGRLRVSVLTRASRGRFAALHPRMPAFVPTARARAWLVDPKPRELVRELLAAPDPPLGLDGAPPAP